MAELVTFQPYLSFGTLSVNGLDMQTGCWFISDMSAVLDDADLRGADRLIPMASGALARRRRRTVSRRDFPMFITGKFNQAGDPIGSSDADWYQGLTANIQDLKGGLGIGEQAPFGIEGTVDVVWTEPGGNVQTKAAHVLSPLKIQTKPGFVAAAVLSLEFPDGVFS